MARKKSLKKKKPTNPKKVFETIYQENHSKDNITQKALLTSRVFSN